MTLRTRSLTAVTMLTLALLAMSCNSRHVSTSLDEITEPYGAGTLVDWTHLSRTPVPGHPTLLADIYRFSYVTRSDTQEVATARLAVPAGGSYTSYDLVAHLHGTIGFADHCAPSLMPGFGFESPLNPIPGDMVAAGRIVVMPDYPGLGVPGAHRYVERDATGRSVWDALTAARALVPLVRPTTKTSNRVMLTGHSQGGHATLAALATQRPSDDFKVVGAVAFAPPGDALAHARLVADGEARAAPLAWGLMSYARAYPDQMQPDWWLDEDIANELPGLMEKWCAPKITVTLGNNPDDIFSDQAMRVFRSGEVPPGLLNVLQREGFEDLHTDTEVRIYQGTRDDLLPPQLSEALAASLAMNGNDVQWHAVEGAGHLSVPRRTRSEVVAWIDQKFEAQVQP